MQRDRLTDRPEIIRIPNLQSGTRERNLWASTAGCASIFGAEQSDAPERHDSDGEPVPAPVGDRGNGESQSGVSGWSGT